MNNRQASQAFARGENPRTSTALTFRGDVAYSYSEPIAVRVNGKLLRTLARFSVTTSKHTGMVGGSWAVTNGVETVQDVPHKLIRAITRGYGLPVGEWGEVYD